MLAIQFTPFPVLHTPRLILRQLTPDDAPAVQFFRSDAAFLRYVPREPEPSMQQAQEHIQLLHDNWANNISITWGLSWPNQPDLLGTICLWNLQPENYRAEIGYGLHPVHSRQGLMSEAMAAVVRFGLETMKLHSIEAHLDPGNDASIRLLEKHGFVREGLFRENIYFGGQFLDTAVYTRWAPAQV
ncbi:GNAT family N-acetyltransferase [Hymenobacter negativus]|uniref:GNAT family N-acetyltransferase n=1 Tax=Hymenobacter negativus TaxID=2795026 RepID=A0ABS3QJ89_9BACT|nr:GNAT family N-acetyltransferase [Hymenobacter negativus]MBO2011321.1 GNAT family N-acetyltransferase [Hymenobacter negativus]